MPRIIAAPASVLGILALSLRLGAQVPGDVRGRIIDASSGRPVPGARVELVGRTEYALSDVTGSFLLRGPEPGTFELRIRALGHAPRDTTVSISNGRTTIVDMALATVSSRLDPIVVHSARDTANVFTFNRHAIQQSAHRDLGELLQAAPGIVVTRAGGPGSPSHISIRGSGANEVLVVVDGNPINSPITGEADLSDVRLETVEHVRVLPGAQSARYGGRALAGVVLIETRRASAGGSGAVTIGSWGERSASIALGQTRSQTNDRVTGSVAADYRDQRGDFSYDIPSVRGGGIARRVNADAQSVDVLATAAIEGTDDLPSELRVRSEWQTRRRGLPGSIVQPSTTGRQRDSRVAGGIDGRWTFSRVAWSANVDGTRERATFRDPTPPFGTAYDDAVDANSLTFGTMATAGTRNGSLSIGSEARTLGVTSTMLAPGAPSRQRQWGSWATAHAEHSSARGTELLADASVRTDWDSFLSGAAVSPRLVLTASRAAASVSASVGGAYAPPSLADQFFHEGVLVRPNPNLRPERVRREVELRATLRDTRVAGVDVGGEVAAYRADVDGMILWLPDFRFTWSPSNFDVQRRGWEMSARAAVPSLGADARASMSQSDVSYAGPVLDGQVAYRPRATASAAIGASRWETRIEVNARYVGSRRTVAGSALNSLDPYWLSDATIARRLPWSTWLDVTVGVENLLNRSASMLADYPFPGRAWTVAFRTRRR